MRHFRLGLAVEAKHPALKKKEDRIDFFPDMGEELPICISADQILPAPDRSPQGKKPAPYFPFFLPHLEKSP